MKTYLKQNWVRLLVILLFLAVIFIYSSSKNKATGNEYTNYETKKQFSAVDISSATQITCTYPQGLSVSYMNEITHSFNKPEKNPMIFSFSKLDNPKEGQLSYIDSTQTITTVPLIKIRENDEELSYLDGIGQGYLSVHTIYKKLGVSVYTKSVNLLGFPSGTLAMGSCVGY